jgi:hypothetical protein
MNKTATPTVEKTVAYVKEHFKAFLVQWGLDKYIHLPE